MPVNDNTTTFNQINATLQQIFLTELPNILHKSAQRTHICNVLLKVPTSSHGSVVNRLSPGQSGFNCWWDLYESLMTLRRVFT